MDLAAFFKLSYGVYIVSSASGSRRSGCVVNTVTQVTAEPPKVVVSVSKENFTCQLIKESGFFNVTVLEQEAPMELIRRFGFISGRDEDKFSEIPYLLDGNRIPYPTESAAAVLSCKVINEIDLDTHILFVGLVQEANVLSQAPVMTYAYYHEEKKGTTPANAPSFQKEVKKTGWRCTVCNYVYEGDDLPTDYICPICKKGASFFERI